MRVIFARFSVWFAEMINPYIRRWARKLHGAHVSALPDDGTGLG